LRLFQQRLVVASLSFGGEFGAFCNISIFEKTCVEIWDGHGHGGRMRAYLFSSFSFSNWSEL